MRLAELLETVPSAFADRWIESVVADSRLAGPGALFVARPGTRMDGHCFIAEAVRAGCAAVAGAAEPPAAVAALLRRHRVPYIRVVDPARTVGELAARLHGHPSRALTMIGVTGTNGKTTVATLLYQLFTALGEPSGLIATTGIRVGRDRRPNDHTTPDAVELQQLLAAMVAAGCRYCFMEVTSHAIDQQRIAGIDFRGGIFTTLGHDHLDYHGTIENYARVKRRFLASLPELAFALANAGDPRGRFMVATTTARVAFYGRGGEALLPWSLERSDERGSELRIGPQRVRTSLLGEHNASNLAAVITTACLLGHDFERVLRAVPRLRGARGRMQRVASGPVLGIVDYAHTPESLALVLACARRLRPRAKLIAVGGCGGDRDRQKRPAMGAALAAADVAIFTSDNPRSEDAQSIVEAMLRRLPPDARARVQIELDRREAIERAARTARPGDVILLLGKGHETSQEIAGNKQPWGDAAELRAALGRRSPRPARQSLAAAGR